MVLTSPGPIPGGRNVRPPSLFRLLLLLLVVIAAVWMLIRG